MPNLSVCIITLNEERDLPRCLSSVRGIARQVVVVDSGSGDRTREIAEAAGAEVWTEPFRGHVAQKQFALEKATQEWVLSLDADEWLDEELRRAVVDVTSSSPSGINGYFVKRRCCYLGRWLEHGPWARESKLRLVRRDGARWTGIDPHDRLEGPGPLGRLPGCLCHVPYESLSEHLKKINEYTSMSATTRGPRSLVRLIGEPPFTFLKMYFLQRGFLDGLPGLVAALLSSFYVFLLHAKRFEKRLLHP